MKSASRLRPRGPNDRDEDPRRRGGRAQAPPKAPDRTGLYVGLGVGGVVLVIALAVAMSGSNEPSRVAQNNDKAFKEDLEAAQKLAQRGKLEEAMAALEAAIQNPFYRGSGLMSKARAQVEQFKQQISLERAGRDAILEFQKKVEASKANQTAMKHAQEYWTECGILLDKYGNTALGKILRDLREDLNRWRATGAQDAWQDDYNRTKERIKSQHLKTGNYNQAVKEWRHFQQSYDSADLRVRVDSELRTIDLQSTEDARKVIESAGTGAMARQKLEAEQERFMGTEGQKLIAQKLKTLP